MAFYECEIHGRRRLAFDLAASSWFKAQAGRTLLSACRKEDDSAPPLIADHDLLSIAFAAGLRKDMPKITPTKAMEIIQAHLDGGGGIEDVWSAILEALADSRIYGGGKDQASEAKATE